MNEQFSNINVENLKGKMMVQIEVPGFGLAEVEYLVSDFTGTLSVGGTLIPGVRSSLKKLSAHLKLIILTADTFGKVVEEMEGINCEVVILAGESVDCQKEMYVRKLGPEHVVAIGNGNNDCQMLKIARIGIAVCEGEGVAISALKSADICVRSVFDALNLLIEPLRLKATLRS